MIFRKIIILFLFFPAMGFAQELTTTDITVNKNFSVRKVSVFGLSLGMNKSDAIKTIKSNPKLRFEEETWHNDGSYRITVFDSAVTAGDQQILYLIWWNYQESEMSEITFFRPMKQFLVGNTKKLLMPDAIDSNSELTKGFLIHADSSALVSDLPTIHYRATAYYYFSKGIQITKQEDNSQNYTGQVFDDAVVMDGKKVTVVFELSDFSEPKKRP